jgi:prophage regulatory protein
MEVMTMKKLIRLEAAEEASGYRKTQIYDLVARGLFPRPIKIGIRASRWDADEIAAWQAARIAERDAVAAAHAAEATVAENAATAKKVAPAQTAAKSQRSA